MGSLQTVANDNSVTVGRTSLTEPSGKIRVGIFIPHVISPPGIVFPLTLRLHSLLMLFHPPADQGCARFYKLAFLRIIEGIQKVALNVQLTHNLVPHFNGHYHF